MVVGGRIQETGETVMMFPISLYLLETKYPLV